MKPIGIEPVSPKKFWQVVCLIYKNQEKQKKLLNLIFVNRDLKNQIKQKYLHLKQMNILGIAVMPSIPSIKLNKFTIHIQNKTIKIMSEW